MTMNSTKRSSTDSSPNDEVDLGTLLYKASRSVRSGVQAIGYLCGQLLASFLLLLLFLLRNMVWILAGTIIGFVYGAFRTKATGFRYYSESTLKTNVYSARALYQSIDYYNALASSGATDELAKIFDISPQQAATLYSFSAEPEESEIVRTEMYRQKIREHRLSASGVDTSWAHLINYNEFVKSITKLDYPLHTVTVVSSDPRIFGRLNNGLVKGIASNSFLQSLQTQQNLANADDQRIVNATLQGLDSLRRAYNVRLARGLETTSPATQLALINSNGKSHSPPELEVYDKMLFMADALRSSRVAAVMEKNAVEAVTPFNSVGQQISFFRQSLSHYALIGFCSSMIVLLGVALYRWLQGFESRRSGRNPIAGKPPLS